MEEKEIIIKVAKLDRRVWNTKAVGVGLFVTQLTLPPEEGLVTEIKTYGDRRLATESEIKLAETTEFDGLYHYPYTTSRDAIIEVIERQPYAIQVQICGIFKKNAQDSLGCALDILKATPRQLCEALIKVTEN